MMAIDLIPVVVGGTVVALLYLPVADALLARRVARCLGIIRSAPCPYCNRVLGDSAIASVKYRMCKYRRVGGLRLGCRDNPSRLMAVFCPGCSVELEFRLDGSLFGCDRIIGASGLGVSGDGSTSPIKPLAVNKEVLDVPELEQIPNPALDGGDAVPIADYVLTMLFRQQPAMLHAEFQGGEARWYVRALRSESQSDACVAESKSVGEFRALLALFGGRYMDMQLYGGHAQKSLAQRGRRFHTRFFMSNDNNTGYWIRVYAHAA
jgi:hypothetical protein